MGKNLTDYDEYFVAIVPPPPVFDEALHLKKYMAEKYATKASLKSPPHITLHMPFRWKRHKQAQLIEHLTAFAAKVDPVKVCVDNFGSFAPRVIFLNIVNNETLDALQKMLKKFFKTELNVFNADFQDQAFHPHLTIAFRDLKNAMFKDAWEEFAKKEYKAEFIADKITLLKHDGTRWNVFKEFPLTSSYSTENLSTLATTEG